VREPREDRNEKGNVMGHYLYLYDPHLKPFLEHAAERVEAKPANIAIEGKCIVIKADGVGKDVEFKLLKLHKAEYLTANDIVQTLALYKSLKALRVPVKLTPRGVEVDGETIWALVVTAIERGAPGRAPTEVMPA